VIYFGEDEGSREQDPSEWDVETYHDCYFAVQPLDIRPADDGYQGDIHLSGIRCAVTWPGLH
jgi:hypothetical protein